VPQSASSSLCHSLLRRLCATSVNVEHLHQNRCRCSFVQQYDEKNPNTYQGYNLLVMTMDDLYAKFSLAEATIEFIGHAVALHPDVSYRKRPALSTVKRIKLYYDSMTRFAGLKSPYIYPLYGLGELPQVRM
jgi:Rab GDP dissociation inhibitor